MPSLKHKNKQPSNSASLSISLRSSLSRYNRKSNLLSSTGTYEELIFQTLPNVCAAVQQDLIFGMHGNLNLVTITVTQQN